MIKNTFPGKFIVIEGIDGAGKSTQAAMIANHFYKKGAAVCLSAEPTQLMVGGLIHSQLLGEWKSSPESLQLLFAADRADHLEKEIIPRLKDGIDVICDRYFLSSLAYGTVDCDLDWLAGLNSNFLMPDLTILLDIDAKTAAERILLDGRSIELFEKAETLEIIRKNYDSAVKLCGKGMAIEFVNGARGRDAVFGDIKSVMEKIL